MPPSDKPSQTEINHCVALGNDAYAKGQLVEASTRFVQARLLIKQAGINDSVELRHSLKILGEIYQKRAMPEEGLEILTALRKLDDSIVHRRTYVNLLAQIAADYQKQGDREKAEEAYGEALDQATELLPASDPLISSLNNVCIEFFKRTFKSKKLTVTDTNVRLARLQTEEQVVVPPTEEQLAARAADAAISSVAAQTRGKTDGGQSSLRKMQTILHSSVISIGLSLLLVAALIKAALFVPNAKTVHKETTIMAKIQGQHFESRDNQTDFSIFAKHQCAFKTPKTALKCSYLVVGSNWQVPVSMLRGCLNSDEYWYQLRGDSLVDPNGTMLYRAGAPELADGANLTRAQLLPGDATAASPVAGRSQKVYICEKAEQELTVRYFRSISCTLVWIWAILTFVWTLSVFKLRQSFAFKCASLATTVLACSALAYWYILALSHD